jgi:16S rRNA (guanine527-N7)-methyltransferase
VGVSRETSEPGVAELVSRFGLPPRARGQLEALLEQLEEDPLAPTTVTARSDAIGVHLADSLVALELGEVVRAQQIADLGAGAGFPGFCLASALPSAAVWLLESAARKCEFLRRTRDRGGLDNAEVVCLRVEEWEAGRGRCDLVTARALAPLPVVAEYAAPLLRRGGHLVAWKGRRQADEEAAAHAAASLLGLTPLDPRPVTPYPGSRDRWLHRFEKTTATPDRFPRRPGMARKRPLGAGSAESSRTERKLEREPG